MYLAAAIFSILSTLQPSYALTLELSKEDSNYDDKADVLELNEVAESSEYVLRADQAPDSRMLPLLRLLNLSGAKPWTVQRLCTACGSARVVYLCSALLC